MYVCVVIISVRKELILIVWGNDRQAYTRTACDLNDKSGTEMTLQLSQSHEPERWTLDHSDKA